MLELVTVQIGKFVRSINGKRKEMHYSKEWFISIIEHFNYCTLFHFFLVFLAIKRGIIIDNAIEY